MNSGNLCAPRKKGSSDLADSAIRIFLIDQDGQGRSFTIKGKRAFIGRDFSNDLQLDDPTVSRKHAMVCKDGGRYYIENLNAKNAIRINGQAIGARHRVEVKEGVPIALGNVLISLGTRCCDSIQPDQDPDAGSPRAEGTEESLFSYRLIKYKQNLNLIYGLCSGFLETLEVEKLCERTLDAIFSWGKEIDSGYVLLADGPDGEIREMAGRSRQQNRSKGVNCGRTLAEQVIRDGRPMILPGTVPENKQAQSDSTANMGVNSILCIPLIGKSGTRGLIYLQAGALKRGFSKDDLLFITVLSAPLVLAIEATLLSRKNTKAEAELKRARDDLETAVRERTAELSRAKDEMKELSITDGLTGLNNYRYFMQSLESEFKRAIRHNRIVSLLMIDIDYFKSFNDTYGHLCGDFVIKKVAEMIKRYVRSTDVAARYGGDEIALILPETDKESAIQVAEKLKKEIGGCTFEWLSKSVEVGVSIGLATGPASGIEAHLDLLNAADKALYRAKQEGRNLVMAFESIQKPFGNLRSTGTAPNDSRER
jgi:diguanylate cyclase (GGDEF)-like protein